MTKYENQIPTSMNMSLKAMLSMLRDSLKSGQERRPMSHIPIVKSEFSKTVTIDDHPQVTWFGHSAFLLEIEGARLLLIPCWVTVHRRYPGWGRSATTLICQPSQKIFRHWMPSFYLMITMIIWIIPRFGG